MPNTDKAPSAKKSTMFPNSLLRFSGTETIWGEGFPEIPGAAARKQTVEQARQNYGATAVLRVVKSG